MSPFYSGAGEISVLIVDDDEVSREVLATVFTIDGYDVRTARDGAEALAMLDSDAHRPQVILMDLQMPGLNGAALIAQLRERVPLGSGTILLAMSASEPRADDVKGADGFLRKPFGAKELKRILQEGEQALVQPKQLKTAAQVSDSKGTDLSKTPCEEAVILDWNKLGALRAMMPETSVRQVYTTAVDDLSRRMPKLETAIERRDAKMVRNIGHAIKGGCGMVGAVDAARLGALLEAESDELDNGSAIAAQLRSTIESLKGILEKEFSK